MNLMMIFNAIWCSEKLNAISNSDDHRYIKKNNLSGIFINNIKNNFKFLPKNPLQQLKKGKRSIQLQGIVKVSNSDILVIILNKKLFFHQIKTTSLMN